MLIVPVTYAVHAFENHKLLKHFEQQYTISFTLWETEKTLILAAVKNLPLALSRGSSCLRLSEAPPTTIETLVVGKTRTPTCT